MKKLFFILSLSLSLIFVISGCANPNLTNATVKSAQALMITDAQIEQITNDYIQQSDRENIVCSNSNPTQKKYNDRMTKIIGNAGTLNGKKLDIKVYLSPVQNAFACANGSIRVYSGLMDIMSDDEIFAIMGHEIGHIANKDTKNAFQQALITSALIDVAGATSTKVAKFTDSELRQLGEALAGAQFSQRQEYAADDYGYNFLKKNGKNPKAMASSLNNLQKLFNSSTVDKSKIRQLFSTHPDIPNRIKRLEKK